jgi:FkbM family methyltransferase
MPDTLTQAEGVHIQHHPAIRAVELITRWQPASIVVDFIGSSTRRSFCAGMPDHDLAERDQHVAPQYPDFDNEYFEWVDLIESVEEAGESFIMMELGAGFGRWSVRGALATRRKPGCRFTCIAVEAEPRHFQWMLDHFRDNGVEPHEHDLIWAAVDTRSGFTPFEVGKADGWYGQQLIPIKKMSTPLPPARTRRRLKARSYLGRPPVMSAEERVLAWVPCVTLTELLQPYPRVDLLDLDIQGAEVAVLRSAMESLQRRVRRVHVGTHSAQIEEDLRQLFGEQGWEKLNDYPCQSRVSTPYGEIAFGDGVQTWLNPMRRRTVKRTAPDVMTPQGELEKTVIALTDRVAALESRTQELKAEKVQLREQLRAAVRDRHTRTESGSRVRRLLPRWLARLGRFR